jgi:hypothetical protein
VSPSTPRRRHAAELEVADGLASDEEVLDLLALRTQQLAELQPSRRICELNAPARPRSEAKMTTAERRIVSRSVVSGC